MKKLLTIMTLLLTLCLTCAFAEDTPTSYTSGDYEYILLADGTAQITDYTGRDKKVTVPATLGGHTVTAIGDSAFDWCWTLTGITIPDSVTAIGDGAFYGCTSLTGITIPDSVTSIGTNPFAFCTVLTDIQVSLNHPTLATIDGVLFEKATKKLICYPCAFTEKSYAIPRGIRVIGDSAFSGCDALTSITIPDSVTTIGGYAFYDCESLSGITIPDNVTTIGEGAFYSCKSLTSITLPDSLSTIGGYAFCYCESLSGITLPDNVTTIGDWAFSYCKSLTSITIPDSVTTIGGWVFDGCTALKTVTVTRDSFAEQYCIDNGLSYVYTDTYDWLLD